MTNEDTVEAEVPGRRWRFQFSLATLLVVVTIASALFSLAVWLKPPFILVLLLAIGPVGGAIIVRMRGLGVFGEIALWSGLLTMLMWVSIIICTGIGGLQFRALIFLVNATVAFAFAPLAFLVGVLTGIAWEVCACALKKC